MRTSKHRKLWIWLWIPVIAIAVIGSGIGIGVKIHMDNQRNQEQMVEIMYSKEVQQLIHNDLKNIDKKAFTPGGVIQTFRIEKGSIKHNPMGGINAEIIINGEPKLNAGISIDKQDDKYYPEVITGYSSQLDTAIGAEK